MIANMYVPVGKICVDDDDFLSNALVCHLCFKYILSSMSLPFSVCPPVCLVLPFSVLNVINIDITDLTIFSFSFQKEKNMMQVC